ncbi:MAG TPA: hypothetical protein VHV55_14570 [Pirellulales bacterium]|nr:hypothetical protein [Pirellulales bacterium]
MLELIDDDQHLLAGLAPLISMQSGQRVLEAHFLVYAGAPHSQAMQQPGFGFVCGGLDMDGDYIARQPGEQTGFHQRRFAAAARPVNQAHRERRLVLVLDSMLPKADALGQAVFVPRTWQQIEEEISVVSIERPQAFGDDGQSASNRGRRFLRPVLGLRWSGLLSNFPIERSRPLNLEVPFDDRHQLRERLKNVGDGDLFVEGVRADVAQLSDRIGVGVQTVREKTVFDEPLKQVFQRSRAGRFFDPPLVHVSNDVLQYLAGTGQSHLRVCVGNLNRLLHAIPKFTELVGKVVQPTDQGSQRSVHRATAPDHLDRPHSSKRRCELATTPWVMPES